MLLDDLVRAEKDDLRDREAEGLRGPRKRGRVSLPDTEGFHSEAGNVAEVSFVAWAYEYTETQVGSCRSYRKVISGDEAPLSAENCKKVRPALGDLRAKTDNWDASDKGVQLCSTSFCPGRTVRQQDTD